MNGRDFYNEFKDALDYLGVGFAGMVDANVVLDGDKVFMYVDGGRRCSFEIPVLPISGDRL